MSLGKKGQANSAVLAGMLLLVVIGVIGITSITIYSSIDTSLTSTITSTTSAAIPTINNFSDNTYEGYSLAGNVPIVIAAGLLISIILAFAVFTR